MGMFDNEIRQYENYQKNKQINSWLDGWKSKYGNCVFPMENYFVKTYSGFVKRLISEYIIAMKTIHAEIKTISYGSFFHRKLYGLPISFISYCVVEFYAVDEKGRVYFINGKESVMKSNLDRYLTTLYRNAEKACSINAAPFPTDQNELDAWNKEMHTITKKALEMQLHQVEQCSILISR